MGMNRDRLFTVKSKRDTRYDTTVIGSKTTNANDNEGIVYALAA